MPVQLRSLDSIVAERGYKRLDLVKLDVEGHEAHVLEGGAQTLRELQPALIFESGHESPQQRLFIANLLSASGYEFVAVVHHYGALVCTASDYRAGTRACSGTEARNLLALPC